MPSRTRSRGTDRQPRASTSSRSARSSRGRTWYASWTRPAASTSSCGWSERARGLPARRARRARAPAGPGVQLEVDRGHDRRRLQRAGRLSKPLVVIDADVLGRQRTGDETYVEQLLRALPRVADDLRFAAITRRPELVPEGVESLNLPARSQE